MKTIEELYKAILADSDLKAKCAEAIKDGKLDEFLKAQGCDATAEEVRAFLDSKKEVSFDELDSVAGGDCDADDIGWSIMTFGVGCGVSALMTEAYNQNHNAEVTSVSCDPAL